MSGARVAGNRIPPADKTRIRRPGPRVGLVLLLLAGLQGCAAPQPKLHLASVDMNRMYGGWYLLATMPNWFERGLVAPYDVYAKRPDGDIREDFYARRGGFAAPLKHFVVHDWVVPGTNAARWRVQIIWPINLPFLVLYADPNYRFVLFGEANRKLGWIYSRSPLMSDPEYRALLARFAADGYDTTKFRRFVQLPAQIGQPGFWSAGIKP